MKSLLKKAILPFSFIALFFASNAYGQVGFNVGGGLPYLSQAGLNFVFSKSFTADLAYNQLSLSAGEAEVKMTKPEVMLKWHPFEGSFFLGLGVGQFTLESTGTDPLTDFEVTLEVKATAITPTIGWMWGIADGGFFGGLDFGYQSPSGAEIEVKDNDGLAETDEAYQDAEDQAETLGETGVPLFTFLRLGYIF